MKNTPFPESGIHLQVQGHPGRFWGLKAKIPSAVVQKIIGWSSSDMVNLYNDNEVDEELGEYFDENGIKENIKSSSLADLN